MADYRFAIVPLDIADKEKAITREIVADKETNTLYTKATDGNLYSRRLMNKNSIFIDTIMMKSLEMGFGFTKVLAVKPTRRLPIKVEYGESILTDMIEVGTRLDRDSLLMLNMDSYPEKFVNGKRVVPNVKMTLSVDDINTPTLQPDYDRMGTALPIVSVTTPAEINEAEHASSRLMTQDPRDPGLIYVGGLFDNRYVIHTFLVDGSDIILKNRHVTKLRIETNTSYTTSMKKLDNGRLVITRTYPYTVLNPVASLNVYKEDPVTYALTLESSQTIETDNYYTKIDIRKNTVSQQVVYDLVGLTYTGNKIFTARSVMNNGSFTFNNVIKETSLPAGFVGTPDIHSGDVMWITQNEFIVAGNNTNTQSMRYFVINSNNFSMVSEIVQNSPVIGMQISCLKYDVDTSSIIAAGRNTANESVLLLMNIENRQIKLVDTLTIGKFAIRSIDLVRDQIVIAGTNGSFEPKFNFASCYFNKSKLFGLRGIIKGSKYGTPYGVLALDESQVIFAHKEGAQLSVFNVLDTMTTVEHSFTMNDETHGWTSETIGSNVGYLTDIILDNGSGDANLPTTNILHGMAILQR